jgi:hypothetical protein
MILSLELMLLGIFTLIYIGIVFMIGAKIISKYFAIKDKTFLYAGIGFIGLAFPWSGVAINFISIVFFNVVPSMEVHFVFHGGFSSIFLFFWIMAILNLSGIQRENREKYLVYIGVLSFIVEIMYLSVIFYDTELIGTLMNEIQVDYAPFNEVYLLTQLIIILISGFWLARKSLKSEDKRIRLKGKLLFFAFVLFPIASILEVLVPFIPIIIIARLLIIITEIFIYGGLILPKWMEKLFSRSSET